MKERADAILQLVQAQYLERLTPGRDELLLRMERHAARAGYPISDPEVGAFLHLTAKLGRPLRLLEVGTNIGYGAIVLARAAGDRARVVTLENKAEMCREANVFVHEAGLSSRVQVVCTDALQWLRSAEGPFDYVYLDCMKEDYPSYLSLVLPHMPSGAQLVADNALWKGYVASDSVPEGERVRVAALRAFNEQVVSGGAFDGVILPLGDGIAWGIKR
jgi:predicted O-methyltransferase YrrM